MSLLRAQPGRRIVVSCGLALIALLATSSLAAASDPIGTVSDLATPSGEASSPELPEPSEPSLTAEVTASSEPSLSAEVTASSEPSLTAEVTASSEPSLNAEVTVSSEPSLTAEVTAPSEPSLTAEVTAPSEPSLTVEVTASSEPGLSVVPGPHQAPVLGEGPGEPLPPPQTLLAPVTELVADQPPAATLPEVDELVEPAPPLDGLLVPSTDSVTPELLGITELDATDDVPDVVAPLLDPAALTRREPVEGTDRPAAADSWPSSRSAIEGRGTSTGEGEPVQPDIASVTLINSTRIVLPAAPERGWHREGILPSAVPRIAAGSAGSAGSSSTTDLHPFAAILAVLAAGGAGWRILALRMPPVPTGIWLAAPVPPG